MIARDSGHSGGMRTRVDGGCRNRRK
jgi:hypothetical protein